MAIQVQLGLVADAAHADNNGKLYIMGEFRHILKLSGLMLTTIRLSV